MAEADREYIWETEHRGNILSRIAFKKLGAALRADDEKALLAEFSGQFKGLIPGGTPEHTAEGGTFRASRTEPADTGFESVDREEFVRWLLALRREFKERAEVSFYLMNLAPVKRGEMDGPWEGTAKIRIWGETRPERPAERIGYLRMRLDGLSKERVEAPGWLAHCRVDRLESTDAEGYLFAETARKRGVEPFKFHDNWNQPRHEDIVNNSGGVFLADYNRDGYMDMLVTDVKYRYKVALYRGMPDGRMREVTREIGLKETASTLAAFVDLDGDGWEDLIHGWIMEAGAYRVYRNLQGQRFEDVTDRCNLAELIRRVDDTNEPTAYLPADYDRDGRVDLYVTRGSGSGFNQGSWIDGETGSISNNQLLRNTGDWQFEDVTAATGTAGDGRSSFSAMWLDADNDGWPDLYVIHEFGEGVLLVNRGGGGGGKFEERIIVDEPSDFGSMGVAAADYNNDGNIDIYVNNMYSKAGNRIMGNMPPGTYPDEVMQKLRRLVDGSELYQGLGDGRYLKSGKSLHVEAVGWSWGPQWVDIDNDGFEDLYATCGYISQDRSRPDG